MHHMPVISSPDYARCARVHPWVLLTKACPAHDRCAVSGFSLPVLPELALSGPKAKTPLTSFVSRAFWMRRGRDSNPRYGVNPHTRFPGEPLQPLGHLSVLQCATYACLQALFLGPRAGLVNLGECSGTRNPIAAASPSDFHDFLFLVIEELVDLLCVPVGHLLKRVLRFITHVFLQIF